MNQCIDGKYPMKQFIKYGMLFSSLVLVTACQPKQNTEQTQKAEVAVKATPLNQNTSSYFITTQVLAQMLQETMSLILHLGNQQVAAQKLKPIASDEQIKCYVTSHQDQVFEQLQKYLTSQFSQQELEQMNQYFASAAGQKQMSMATQDLIAAIQQKQPSTQNMPTAEEQKQIEQFVTSALGMKLQKVLQNQNEINQYMGSVLEEKLKTCKIDVTPLDTPTKKS